MQVIVTKNELIANRDFTLAVMKAMDPKEFRSSKDVQEFMDADIMEFMQDKAGKYVGFTVESDRVIMDIPEDIIVKINKMMTKRVPLIAGLIKTIVCAFETFTTFMDDLNEDMETLLIESGWGSLKKVEAQSSASGEETVQTPAPSGDVQPNKSTAVEEGVVE